MQTLIKSKLKASAIHMTASLLIVSIYLGLVYFQWYPYPFYAIENTWDVIQLVIGIDLILGPALTLIVYKPGKLNLKFDLSAIILLQLAALSWGVWATFEARPAFVVFERSRATILSHNEITPSEIEDNRLRQLNRAGPQLIFLRPPASQEEFSEMMERAFNGIDPVYQAKFFAPLYDYREKLLPFKIDIREQMHNSRELTELVEKFLADNHQTLDNLAFFPIRGRNKNNIIILTQPRAEVVGYLDFDPKKLTRIAPSNDNK